MLKIMFSEKEFQIWDFKSFIFWSKISFLRDCFSAFNQKFSAAVNQSGQHFYSAKYQKYMRYCEIYVLDFEAELEKEKRTIQSGNINHWKQKLKIFRENQNKRKAQM